MARQELNTRCEKVKCLSAQDSHRPTQETLQAHFRLEREGCDYGPEDIWDVLLAGGRITALLVPHAVQPSDPSSFQVTFASRQEVFDGQVTLAIYSAAGALLTVLEAPLSVPAGDEVVTELSWDATGATIELYSADAQLTDLAETVTYSTMPRAFYLVQRLYLPPILRQG